MLYRIYFNPDGGFWIIQVSRFGLLWRTVTSIEHHTDEPVYSLKVRSFPTAADASTYAESVGLDATYRRVGLDASRRPEHSYLRRVG